MLRPFESIFHALVLLIVLSCAVGHTVAQDKFVLTPNVSSSIGSIWTDSLTTTTTNRVGLPASVAIKNQPSESTQTKSVMIKRKRATPDPAQVAQLQITYQEMLASSSGASSSEASLELSEPLQNRTFSVDCSSGAVTVNPESPAVTADEISLVKRECQTLESLNALASFINGISVGETRSFNDQHPFPFVFQNIEDFGLKSGEITLRKLSTDAPVTATFSLSAQTESVGATGESLLVKYQGQLVIDSQGHKIELTLKSEPVLTERSLPDGRSQIKSRIQLTHLFRREIS